MPLEEAVYLRDRLSWLGEFNPVLISGEIRCVKPNLDIFRRCIELLRVKPGHTLLIDDRVPNVNAAQALGIQTILFRSNEQLSAEAVAEFGLPAIAPLTGGAGAPLGAQQ
jgi:FMN phosphatase YigB (HAD superfamily)